MMDPYASGGKNFGTPCLKGPQRPYGFTSGWCIAGGEPYLAPSDNTAHTAARPKFTQGRGEGLACVSGGGRYGVGTRRLSSSNQLSATVSCVRLRSRLLRIMMNRLPSGEIS